MARTKLIIDKDFQFRLMYFMLASLLTVAAIYFFGFIYFLKNLQQLGTSIGLQPDHPYFIFLKTQQTKILLIFGVSTVIAFSLFSALSFFISHRIVGPILKLQNHLDHISEGGQPEEITFRKNDFFNGLADSVNRAVKKLSQ